MTSTTGHRPLIGRGKLLIALLAATAMLAAGAQALAPAPAAAVINEGEECDPNTTSSSFDCEPDGGGGGGSGGGGDNTGGGEAGTPGDPETRGQETIVIESTVSNQPACRQGSLCLPSQPGSRQRPDPDNRRNPHQPRQARRPARQVSKAPTKLECSHLKVAEFQAVPSEPRLALLEASLRRMEKNLVDLHLKQQNLNSSIGTVTEELRILREDPTEEENGARLEQEEKLLDLRKELADTGALFKAIQQMSASAIAERDGLVRAMQAKCKGLYGQSY